MHTTGPANGPRPAPDFSRAPHVLIWEITRACALVCRHCRAAAQDRRDPAELSTDEGRDLLNQAAAMGVPIVVLTGGDPLQREDLEDLIAHGTALGLRMATIPAETPRLTPQRIASLAAAGVAQIALSLDGSRPDVHDRLRGVPGCFEIALNAARWIREAGVPLQINTMICAQNRDELKPLAELVRRLGIVFWEIFLLVPTGRGAELPACSPAEVEELFANALEIERDAPFVVRLIEAPHYRRFLRERGIARLHPGGTTERRRGVAHAARPVNAGNGFCFVDHRGEVCPSGFLPLSAGNLRQSSLAKLYRDSPLFRALRDPSRLRGRCGRCEYRELCGGSRSRAYALTGDPFAEDPSCAYEPRPLTAAAAPKA
ncbi:MAG: TIGR04053 family radical SAM/SPASM domain-containing protein [Kiritimatiellae bacterium]|nr:TIGR04053 family radical SAM/SPASM domain-containing protein [Kiritimatiellia bacterium]